MTRSIETLKINGYLVTVNLSQLDEQSRWTYSLSIQDRSGVQLPQISNDDESFLTKVAALESAKRQARGHCN